MLDLDRECAVNKNTGPDLEAARLLGFRLPAADPLLVKGDQDKIPSPKRLSKTDFSVGELVDLASRAGLDQLLSAHAPDHVVDFALTGGCDPCRGARAWFDDSLGQWCRRRKLAMRYIDFVEIAPRPKPQDPPRRFLNPDYRLHVHRLLGGVGPDQIEALVAFLAAESNRVELAAAQHAGRAPRHTWHPGHVTTSGCGVPLHLEPITDLTGAISYCRKSLGQTAAVLTNLMRTRTKNRRQARPLFLSSDLRRLSI